MDWKISFKKSAVKELGRIDKLRAQAILDYLQSLLEDPREAGKALKGEWAGYWRYRIGSYRAICELKDQELIVHVVKVGHRKDIYD